MENGLYTYLGAFRVKLTQEQASSALGVRKRWRLASTRGPNI